MQENVECSFKDVYLSSMYMYLQPIYVQNNL
jgi:hypothetical protein